MLNEERVSDPGFCRVRTHVSARLVVSELVSDTERDSQNHSDYFTRKKVHAAGEHMGSPLPGLIAFSISFLLAALVPNFIRYHPPWEIRITFSDDAGGLL